jgi:phosphonate transport system substrate-binding protein
MGNNHIEFAYFGPKSYTEAAEKSNAEALCLEMDEDRNQGYHGIIITKKGSGIKTMDQAKGHTFAFTDPNSTSGCLVPSVLFYRDMKINPDSYFSEVSFSGSHGASMLAVKNGKIEVAATNDIDLARMVEKGAVSADEFNVLWTSQLIPGAPLCARKDMPASLKAAVRGAILELNSKPETLKKLGVGGYAYCDDATYDMIRFLKKLKKQLQQKKGT